jgi:hypothetical protein
VRDVAAALRIAGIVIGVTFAASMLWIVVLGPAVLTLLRPR